MTEKTPKQKAMELLKPPFKFTHGYIFDSAEQQNKVADEGDLWLEQLRGFAGGAGSDIYRTVQKFRMR